MSTPDYASISLTRHAEHGGKIALASKFPLANADDLSVAYTPGVAAPCQKIADEPTEARKLTVKGNSVAIVTDGSAVLGLGNIGPEAAMPVMEGKALLFKHFAGIDAWPICLASQNTDEIVRTVELIAPGFGGINLEDISAPRCFEIEARLQSIGIPVFHDDQHGTAIVLLAGLLNASKVIGKPFGDLKVVINGAGAAGTAIAKLLRCVEQDPTYCSSVRDIIVCDRSGIISADRDELSAEKQVLLTFTNRQNRSGTVFDALEGADVFIGVSKGNLLKAEHIKAMAKDPIIFAMANPTPEIMPDDARAAGAAVVGTGRSDFPNQINNVLAFPGLFRGAFDVSAERITNGMKIAAAYGLSNATQDISADKVLPGPFDEGVAEAVAKAVSDHHCRFGCA